MYQRYLFLALLLGLLSFSDSIGAGEKQHFETRICRDCDYNHAVNTASSIKPEISCNGQSQSNKAQACHAKPISILVIDADSREMWHFENAYANQGQAIDNLINEVNYQSLIPDKAIELANQLLDTYEKINQLAVKVSAKLNAENVTATINAQSSQNSCDVYQYSQALGDAFLGRFRSRLQYSLQKSMQAEPLLGEWFVVSKLFGLSFSVKNSGASLGGTWQNMPNAISISKRYGFDDLQEPTQVTFTAIMKNDTISVALNGSQTYFNGLSLNMLKEQSISAGLLNECLAQTLDEIFKKTVEGSGKTTPTYNNNIALFGGTHGLNNDTGSEREITCKHTYYINGDKGFSFEGQCPK